jgi:hypothetical protein
MKALTLFFFAVMSYLVGAIAAAVAAPYVALQSLSTIPGPDLTFSLIPLVQAGASLFFLGLALAVLLGEIVTNARAQDEALEKRATPPRSS